ncbi:MAG: hypothetical protein AABZ06_04740 [Bdellovibrionota bacterium]
MTHEGTSYFEPLPLHIEDPNVTQLINATTHFHLEVPFGTHELEEILNRETSIAPRELYSSGFPYHQLNLMACLESVKVGREVMRMKKADPRNPDSIKARVDDTSYGRLSLDPMCTGCHFGGSGKTGCKINDAADKLYAEALQNLANSNHSVE